MKYAHTFASELKHEGRRSLRGPGDGQHEKDMRKNAPLTVRDAAFPSQWVDVAIPYGQLKKCLKKVQRELGDLGLGPDTLSVLLEPGSGSPVLLDYKLDGTKSRQLHEGVRGPGCS